MTRENDHDSSTDSKRISKIFMEEDSGRAFEIIFTGKDSMVILRSPDGTIEHEFEFNINQLGGSHQVKVGLGYFSVRDVFGKQYKYKLSREESKKIMDWYGKDELQFTKCNEKLESCLDTFKKEMGVQELLVFNETEWREDHVGFKSSNEGTIFFIALADNALYLMIEPPERSHPLFTTPIKMINYEECKLKHGGASKIFNLSFFLGSLYRGRSQSVCRLITKEGELFMVGNKEHVKALEKAFIQHKE